MFPVGGRRTSSYLLSAKIPCAKEIIYDFFFQRNVFEGHARKERKDVLGNSVNRACKEVKERCIRNACEQGQNMNLLFYDKLGFTR